MHLHLLSQWLLIPHVSGSLLHWDPTHCCYSQSHPTSGYSLEPSRGAGWRTNLVRCQGFTLIYVYRNHKIGLGRDGLHDDYMCSINMILHRSDWSCSCIGMAFGGLPSAPSKWMAPNALYPIGSLAWSVCRPWLFWGGLIMQARRTRIPRMSQSSQYQTWKSCNHFKVAASNGGTFRFRSSFLSKWTREHELE